MSDETNRVSQLESALRIERERSQQVRRELIRARRDLGHYEAGHCGLASDCEICR